VGAKPSAVVPANAGTHTPRLLESITGASRILDRLLSRAMTVESVANIDGAASAVRSLSPCGRGRGEGFTRAVPMRLPPSLTLPHKGGGNRTLHTRLRIPAACFARVVPGNSALKSEGAGKTGCALHPRSRVQDGVKKRTRAYRFSGGSPAFPAQWF
jgi:hypothetical protein